MRVLLTYNDPIVAALIEAVLRIEAINVVLTHTPEDAERMLERDTFDVHVLDARFADMIGTRPGMSTLLLAGRGEASATLIEPTNELRLPFDAESLVRRVLLLGGVTAEAAVAEREWLTTPRGESLDDAGLLSSFSHHEDREPIGGPPRHRVFWSADRRR